MDKFQTLKIESFSNSGEGIAKVDGFVVFVKDALPGEVVKAEIIKENKHFAKAKIIEIIEPSTHRIKPFCALYNACGACSLQYVDYDYQLELKKLIIKDTMKSIAGMDIEPDKVVPSPEIKEFRCKIQYPTSQTKVSKRILAGYFKTKSHEIVNIKCCPIQPKICDEIVEFIRNKGQELNLTCYNEKSKMGLLRHIVMRYSAYNGDILLTLVINDDKVSNELKELAGMIFDNFDKVRGVCINFNMTNSNLILAKETITIVGNDFIEEKILDKTFKIGANTFFQVNPKSAENIFAYVKDIIKKDFKNPYILDAYAGIASFGIVVSDVAKKVLSVEENENSINLAKEVLLMNSVSNVEVKCDDTGKFLKNCDEKFDVVILDPPRKGCEQVVLDEVMRVCAGEIIYVSCNPATLARDLKYLCEKGAKVKSLRAFDMFCHTLHVENVAVITI